MKKKWDCEIEEKQTTTKKKKNEKKMTNHLNIRRVN